jgi:hypothetical protein
MITINTVNQNGREGGRERGERSFSAWIDVLSEKGI